MDKDDFSNKRGWSLLGRKEIIDRLIIDKEEEKIVISPILSSNQIQPASIDVRLGPDFIIIKIGKITHLDPLRDPEDVKREIEKYTDRYKILNKHERFVLHPDEFVLGCTLEYVCLPKGIAARLEGRSSWGRLGILIHITAGNIDPGYHGNITFELKNTGKVPVPMYPGTRIGQLSFFKVLNEDTYTGKYQDSFGIISSKYFRDVEFEIIRKMYDDKYYRNIVTDIFEATENEKGLPRTPSEDKFPQKLINAIGEIYKNKIEGENEK